MTDFAEIIAAIIAAELLKAEAKPFRQKCIGGI